MSTVIDGSNGYYTGYVANDSVANARNAEHEYIYGYHGSDFELQYATVDENGLVDTDALMGAAFEGLLDLGILSCDEETGEYYVDLEVTGLKDVYGAMDFNGDNKVTLDEYASEIIFEDMQDSDDNVADGVITDEGSYNAHYQMGTDYASVVDQWKEIYNTYNLAEAKDAFYSEESNTYIKDETTEDFSFDDFSFSGKMADYLLTKEEYLGTDEWGGNNENATQDGVLQIAEVDNFMMKISNGLEKKSIENMYNNWKTQNESVGLSIDISYEEFYEFCNQWLLAPVADAE